LVINRCNWKMSTSILDISAHKHGNYHKYYTFHPTTSRMDVIGKYSLFYNLWNMQGQPKIFAILDVGCNEGDLSIEIFQLARLQIPQNVQCILLGVDLDPSLIELANQRHKVGDLADIVDFRTMDFMNGEESSRDINSYMQAFGITGFSFVSLFSITMWIHLNFGDTGLHTFLSNSVKFLLPNVGSLLVEPQPWKCYKNAVKRCRKLGMEKPLHFDDIKPQDMDVYITQYLLGQIPSSLGMKSCQNLGQEKWGRSILLFHLLPNVCDMEVMRPQKILEEDDTIDDENATDGDDTTMCKKRRN